jgi:hypothetical protein
MSVTTDSHGQSARATQTALDISSVATGAQAGRGELTNEMGIIEPDPLTLTLYPDAMHDHDIMEDPMLEEFTASLIGNRIVTWPSLEHLLSPTALSPQLQDEASVVATPQLEVEDPAVVSYELQTPPPRPIQWAVDSPKNDDSAKRRLDSFINEVTRKRDSPLIREPPK